MREAHTYENISPTAVLIAYLRSFSDIPYSKEIFGEISTEEKFEDQKSLAPRYEARYKLVDQMLAKFGTPQILEVAAGFAPRGLVMAADDSSGKYLEFDLPIQVSNKEHLVQGLERRHGLHRPANWEIISGNALDSLGKTLDHFDRDKPISVINEGLMRYLTMREKARLAANVYHLLEVTGGVWITPDITLSSMVGGSNPLSRLANRVSQISRIDLTGNNFKDVEEGEEFFNNQGFNVERHSFLEVSDLLTSPRRLGISSRTVEELNAGSVLFVMTPTPKIHLI